MIRPVLIAALVIGAASCADSGPAVEHVTLDGIDYAVPAGWRGHDQSEHHTKIVVWTPGSNPRKESVTVMRTRPMPAVVKAGASYIERLLVEAQGNLRNGRFGHTTRFKTKRGLVGVRVEGEFVPSGAVLPYRRVHAVVFDSASASLTHVLYTARVADLAVFELVLDSLYRKAA